jgi:hypothetical protein
MDKYLLVKVIIKWQLKEFFDLGSGQNKFIAVNTLIVEIIRSIYGESILNISN